MVLVQSKVKIIIFEFQSDTWKNTRRLNKSSFISPINLISHVHRSQTKWYATYGCNVWWYIVAGRLDRYVLVFAEVDTSAPLAEQFELQSLIPRSRYGPVDLLASSLFVLPSSATSGATATTTTAHAVVALWLDPTIIALGLLPPVVTAARWRASLVAFVTEVTAIFRASIATAEVAEVSVVAAAGVATPGSAASAVTATYASTATVAIVTSVAATVREARWWCAIATLGCV